MEIAVKELDHEEWVEHIISDFDINLGNNFSYDHFAREIHKNKVFMEYYESEVSLSDEVTFQCKGNYGPILQETCASDLSDHFRSYDRELERTEESIPWADE